MVRSGGFKGAKRRSPMEQAIQIRNEALAIIESANAQVPAIRQVTNASALEVVWRSLNETRFLQFSSRRDYALNELCKFIDVAQGTLNYLTIKKHSDLLNTAHPYSAAPHAMTAAARNHAQMQWYMADPIVTEETAPLLASAFAPETDEITRTYALTRLTASAEGLRALEAITAAFSGDGNSYFARRMRAMRQRRDRLGRFAEEGGGMRSLVRLEDGSVHWLTGRSVGADPNSNTFDVETPRGIVRVPAGSAEGIEAYLPGQEGPNGVSPAPAKISSADESDVISEADLQVVDAPAGWEPVQDFKGNEGEKAFTDGTYVVAQTTGEDGKNAYRLIDEDGTEISQSDSWAKMLDDSINDALGGEERPELPEDMLLSGLEEIANNETAGSFREVARKMHDYLKRNLAPEDETPESLAARSKRIADALADDKGKAPEDRLFEKKFQGFEDDFRKGADAINAKLEGTARQEQRKEDKTPQEPPMKAPVDKTPAEKPMKAPVAELPSEEPMKADEVPAGAYEVDKGAYTPRGYDGQDSEEYTDDPQRLARMFTPAQLKKALKEGVLGEDPTAVDGSGDSPLEFSEGTEYVPTDAIYHALKEFKTDGTDPDAELAKIYDEGNKRLAGIFEAPTSEEDNLDEEIPDADIPDISDEEADAFLDENLDEDMAESFVKVMDKPEISEVKPVESEVIDEDYDKSDDLDPESDEEEAVPALIDSLSDEEKQAFADGGFDHTPYLPANEEIELPEGYHVLDPEPFALDNITTVEEGDELNQSGIPVGWTDDPYFLARDFDTQDLIDSFEFALEPRDEDSEYDAGMAPISVTNEDGEEVIAQISAEAIRDALQLQGEDTNELTQRIADEAFASLADQGEIAPDVEDGQSSGDLSDEEMRLMMEGEGIPSEDEKKIPTEEALPETPQAEIKVAPTTEKSEFVPSDTRQTIPYDTLTWDDAQGKAIPSSGESQIVDFGGRKIVVMDINGTKIPFYISTGSGGKRNVTAGKWYPFFGISSHGWFNKTTEEDINNYYGSPELKAQAEWLDANIGDIRDDSSIPKVKGTGSHMDFINQDLNPAENGTRTTIEDVKKNIEDTKAKLAPSQPSAVDKGAFPETPEEPTAPATDEQTATRAITWNAPKHLNSMKLPIDEIDEDDLIDPTEWLDPEDIPAGSSDWRISNVQFRDDEDGGYYITATLTYADADGELDMIGGKANYNRDGYTTYQERRPNPTAWEQPKNLTPTADSYVRDFTKPVMFDGSGVMSKEEEQAQSDAFKKKIEDALAEKYLEEDDVVPTPPVAPAKVFRGDIATKNLQPGDVTVGDNFVIVEVGTEPITEFNGQPLSSPRLLVRGYFPGHAIQEKPWNPDTEIPVVRGISSDMLPPSGDLPELHKPNFRGLRGGRNNKEYLLAYAKWRGALNAARDRWSTKPDAAKTDFNPATDTHRVKLNAQDLKPGDVSANPAKGHFTITSVSQPDPNNPDHAKALKEGRLIVSGYYPGHEIQEKQWYPTQRYPMEFIRNGVVPDSGPLPKINQPSTTDEDGNYVRLRDPELMREYKKKIAEASSGYVIPENAPLIDAAPSVAENAPSVDPVTPPTATILPEPKAPYLPDDPFAQGAFADLVREAGSWSALKESLKGKTLVFFDYETTGFGVGEKNNPVQLGAVKVVDGEIVDRFNVHMNPETPLTDWSAANLKDADGNPTTNEWLAGQMSMADAHQQFADWAGQDAILGAHKTDFDRGVLERVLSNTGIEMSPAGYINTLTMAREIHKDDPDSPQKMTRGQLKDDNTLKSLADYYGFPLGDGWHTADADSETTAKLFTAMIDAAESKGIGNDLFNVDANQEAYDVAMEQYLPKYNEYLGRESAYLAQQLVLKAAAGEEVNIDDAVKALQDVKPEVNPSEVDVPSTGDVAEVPERDSRLATTEWATSDENTREIPMGDIRFSEIQPNDFMTSLNGNIYQVLDTNDDPDFVTSQGGRPGQSAVYRVKLETGEGHWFCQYANSRQVSGVRRPINPDSLAFGDNSGDQTLTKTISTDDITPNARVILVNNPPAPPTAPSAGQRMLPPGVRLSFVQEMVKNYDDKAFEDNLRFPTTNSGAEDEVVKEYALASANGIQAERRFINQYRGDDVVEHPETSPSNGSEFNAETTVTKNPDGSMTASTEVFDADGDTVALEEKQVSSIEEAQEFGDTTLDEIRTEIADLTRQFEEMAAKDKPTVESVPEALRDVRFPTVLDTKSAPDQNGTLHEVTISQLPNRQGGGFEVGLFIDNGKGEWVEVDGPDNFARYETLGEARDAARKALESIKPVEKKPAPKPAKSTKDKMDAERTKIQDGAYLRVDYVKEDDGRGGVDIVDEVYSWQNPDGSTVPLNPNDPKQGADTTEGRVFGKEDTKVVEKTDEVDSALADADLSQGEEEELGDEPTFFEPGTPINGLTPLEGGTIVAPESVTAPDGTKYDVAVQLLPRLDGSPEVYQVVAVDPNNPSIRVLSTHAATIDEAKALHADTLRGLADGSIEITTDPNAGRDVNDVTLGDSSPYTVSDLMPNMGAMRRRIIGDKRFRKWQEDNNIYGDGVNQARLGDRVVHTYDGWNRRGEGTILGFTQIHNSGDRNREAYAIVTFEDGSYALWSTRMLFLNGRTEGVENRTDYTPPEQPGIRPFLDPERKQHYALTNKYKVERRKRPAAQGGGWYAKVLPYISKNSGTEIADTRRAYEMWNKKMDEINDYRRAHGLPVVSASEIKVVPPSANSKDGRGRTWLRMLNGERDGGPTQFPNPNQTPTPTPTPTPARQQAIPPSTEQFAESIENAFLNAGITFSGGISEFDADEKYIDMVDTRNRKEYRISVEPEGITISQVQNGENDRRVWSGTNPSNALAKLVDLFGGNNNGGNGGTRPTPPTPPTPSAPSAPEAPSTPEEEVQVFVPSESLTQEIRNSVNKLTSTQGLSTEVDISYNDSEIHISDRRVRGSKSVVSWNDQKQEFQVTTNGTESSFSFASIEDATNQAMSDLYLRRTPLYGIREMSTGGTASRPYPEMPRTKTLNEREINNFKNDIVNQLAQVNEVYPVNVTVDTSNPLLGTRIIVDIPDLGYQSVIRQEPTRNGWSVSRRTKTGSYGSSNYTRSSDVLNRVSNTAREAADAHSLDRVRPQRQEVLTAYSGLTDFEGSISSLAVDTAGPDGTWKMGYVHQPRGYRNKYLVDVVINPNGENTATVSVVTPDATFTKYEMQPSSELSDVLSEVNSKVAELAQANNEESLLTQIRKANERDREILQTQLALNLPANPVPIYRRFLNRTLGERSPVQQLEFSGLMEGVIDPRSDKVSDHQVLTPNGEPLTQQYLQDLGWEAEKAAQIAHAGVHRASIDRIVELRQSGNVTESNRLLAEAMGKGVQFGPNLKIGNVRVSGQLYNGTGTLNVSLGIIKADGSPSSFSDASRELHFKDGKLVTVKNAYMVVNGRGSSGFSSLFNQYTENWYIANGAEYVKVQAAGGMSFTGAYVWAITGYNWNKPEDGFERLKAMHQNLEQGSDRYIDGDLGRIRAKEDMARAVQQAFDAYGLPAGDWNGLNAAMSLSSSKLAADFPTPRELAMIGWHPDLRSTGQSWFGKNYMINNSWYGKKSLVPTATERIQNHTYDDMKKSVDELAASGANSFDNTLELKSHFATPATYQGTGSILAPYADELTQLTGYDGTRSISQLSPPAKAALGKYLSKVLSEKDGSHLVNDGTPSGNAKDAAVTKGLVDMLDALQKDRLSFEPNRAELSQNGKKVQELSADAFDSSMAEGVAKPLTNPATGEAMPFTITKLASQSSSGTGDGPRISGPYAGASDIWKIQHDVTGEVFFVKKNPSNVQVQGEVAGNALARSLGIVGLPVVDTLPNAGNSYTITSELGTNLSIPAINLEELTSGSNGDVELDTPHLVRMSESPMFNPVTNDISQIADVNNSLGMMVLDAVLQNEDRGGHNVMMVKGNSVPGTSVTNGSWIPVPFDHADSEAVRTAIEQTAGNYQSPIDYLHSSLGESNHIAAQFFDSVGPVTFKMLVDKRIEEAEKALKAQYGSYMTQEVMDMLSDRLTEMKNYTTDDWTSIYG